MTEFVTRICDHHYDPAGGCEGVYDQTGVCDQCGRPPLNTDTPWEFVQDDTDDRRGVARVLTSRNELVCA